MLARTFTALLAGALCFGLPCPPALADSAAAPKAASPLGAPTASGGKRGAPYTGTLFAVLLPWNDDFATAMAHQGVNLAGIGGAGLLNFTYYKTIEDEYHRQGYALSEADILEIVADYLTYVQAGEALKGVLSDRQLAYQMSQVPRAERKAKFPQFAQDDSAFFDASQIHLSALLNALKKGEAGFPKYLADHIGAYTAGAPKIQVADLSAGGWKIGDDGGPLLQDAAKTFGRKLALMNELEADGSVAPSRPGSAVAFPLRGGVAVQPLGANYSAYDGQGHSLKFTCAARGHKVFEVSINDQIPKGGKAAVIERLIARYGAPRQRVDFPYETELVWGASYPVGDLGHGPNLAEGMFAIVNDMTVHVTLASDNALVAAGQCNALADERKTNDALKKLSF
jgi:hypothetical protein